jgi:hypothetical protein
LHVRPTELTTDYLAAAKTWKAADELIADITTGQQQQVSKNADQSSAETLNSNADSKFAKPGSATMLNPNNITNVHLNNKDKENEQCAPASPTCADVHAALDSKLGQEEMTLKELFEVWETTAQKFYSDEIAAGKLSGKLTPKEKGYIAKFLPFLCNVTAPNYEVVDFRQHADDMVGFCVSNWPCLSSENYPYSQNHLYPQASILAFHPNAVLNGWIKAGKPKHETAYPTMFGCEYKKS